MSPAPARWLEPIDDPFPLADLAERIRASSNFRFAWRFFSATTVDLRTEAGARGIVDSVVAYEPNHTFLRASFKAAGDEAFAIQPSHAHARCVRDDDGVFDLLARAAADRLGAYSRNLDAATAAERRDVSARFAAYGEACGFELAAGAEPSCFVCARHTGHLFSSWFYGVAWDWCVVVTWPERGVAWVGCLTDTD